jgi:hypothetical protein
VTSFDGINLTSTHTLVEITDILIPAAIISSHGKRSLKSFGPTPFSLVCLRSHLHVFDPSKFRLPLQLPQQQSQSTELAITSGCTPAISLPNEGSSAAECDTVADGAGTLLRESLGANGIETENLLAVSESSPMAREIDIETNLSLLPGTNFTVHTHLRSHLPTSGASVRHANASLCDFVLHHNLRVNTTLLLTYCNLLTKCIIGWNVQ